MDRSYTNAAQTWQDVDGFVQACEVRGGQRVLYCSGQLSVNEQGKPMYPGDMRAQINCALDNLESVLTAAGYSMADLVRLNIYTTNIDECLKNWDTVFTRANAAGCKYACSLFGVVRLAWPDTLVEIEATAVG
jgi:enamine deaminase RidA (YjgF/YER057c/UK114 family)